MKAKISKSDFDFQFAGHGHYKVTYTSPKTGKKWTKTINDMQIIDQTKNAEKPQQLHLNFLKYLIKKESL